MLYLPNESSKYIGYTNINNNYNLVVAASFYAMRILVWLLAKISFNSAYYLSKVLALLLSNYRKNVVIENASNSFPNVHTRQFHEAYKKHLAKVIVESLKAYSLPQEEIARRFKFLNPELANKYYDQGKSIILLLGHVGNWEWGQAVVTHYLRYRCVGAYKPLKNGRVDLYLLSLRSRFGVRLLPTKKMLKFIISNIESANCYVFIADQYSNESSTHSLTFLSQQTKFDTTAERIAVKYNLPVIYARIEEKSEGYYETQLIEISQDSADTSEMYITTRYAALLEENIKSEREKWLWSHKRWK